METAIGVFSKRENAEGAVKSLLQQQVPEERIIFLTRSETEAGSVGRQLGACAGGIVGGTAGMSVGLAAASVLAIPGVGPVFALGLGAAALLGLVGAGTGAAVGAGASNDPKAPPPSSGTGSTEDLALFRRVLNEGHSVVVVRTESPQIASRACAVLNELGIRMEQRATARSSASWRQADGAVVVDLTGKIALAEGTALLRDTIRNILEQGNNRIVLNLEAVEYIDSAGIGELIRTHASVRSRGGQLKLVNARGNVYGLLKITRLDNVFDIEPDELTALRSLRQAFSAGSAN
ncbi:MAG TPA: STAS domain-containing protein [Candidatus Acidoferrum sp.]|jgi:anti-sigma B factor antagonist